jgi:alginate O-acetyltransferase complex protein AlgI
MIFNSIGFGVFFPIVFVLYWFVANRSLKLQNGLLLVSSYFFYACWDWRFLFLLLFSTLLDFFSGLKMSSTKSLREKKTWFWLSILVNLGFLGIFKYYNFFITSFATVLSGLGIHVDVWILQVILPVGISFYTFHGLSYVIDIYKGRIQVERNFVDYAVFVSFFPLLVAGPIERADHLLPQIKKRRTFDYSSAVNGLTQIMWGLFKKIVIADQCANYVNLIFDNYSAYSGSTLVLGGILFAFQIYGDFSGYSDIALGTARLLGIELLRNFSFPYFSRNIAEFWRRWHISLSSWFRDYVYIPLGGNRGNKWQKVKNVLIIFLLSGLWHGANWTFIVWGLLNAVYIIPSVVREPGKRSDPIVHGNSTPQISDWLSICATFGLTVLAWIFFRSPDIASALEYIRKIFSFSISLFNGPSVMPCFTFIWLFLFLMIEWMGRDKAFAIEDWTIHYTKFFKVTFYYAIVLAILYYAGENHQFIYFQF